MKIRNGWLGIKYLTITMILSQGISFNALAHEGEDHNDTPAPKIPKPPSCQLLTADRLFDGENLLEDCGSANQKRKSRSKLARRIELKRHTAKRSNWVTRPFYRDLSNHMRI